MWMSTSLQVWYEYMYVGVYTPCPLLQSKVWNMTTICSEYNICTCYVMENNTDHV